ncbi:hypothetical protein CBS11852_10962 [Aspergillus niger]|nr:hypothetical protein CBS11852_10962 [Aspergillus niger]
MFRNQVTTERLRPHKSHPKKTTAPGDIDEGLTMVLSLPMVFRLQLPQKQKIGISIKFLRLVHGSRGWVRMIR